MRFLVVKRSFKGYDAFDSWESGFEIRAFSTPLFVAGPKYIYS